MKTTEAVRESLIQIKRQAEQMRIWGGMQWHYHPLQAERIHDEAEKAIAALSASQQAGAQGDFEELLGRYWTLAFSEGESGVSHGDEANEVLHALRGLYCPSPALPEGLVPTAYRVGPIGLQTIKIEEVSQIDGSVLWAVRRSGDCMNKSGEWEWEPMPSSRDDEFLQRCRYPSPQEAYVVIAAAPNQDREEG